MEIYAATKNYRKEEKSVQNAILSGLQQLAERIQLYESQGIEFHKIYNDDIVKYDQHGQFFTYKCHKGRMQMRILYAYVWVKERPVILVVDYFLKKKPKKDYIKWFDNWNELDPIKEYENSYYVATVN